MYIQACIDGLRRASCVIAGPNEATVSFSNLGPDSGIARTLPLKRAVCLFVFSPHRETKGSPSQVDHIRFLLPFLRSTAESQLRHPKLQLQSRPLRANAEIMSATASFCMRAKSALSTCYHERWTQFKMWHEKTDRVDL